MKIIGIDPGYERLGIAIIEKPTTGRETVLYSTCFKTSASLDFNDRLLAVAQELRRIIDEYHPQYCAIEELYFAKNTKTAMKVAEVRGSIITIMRLADIIVHEYHPNTIKIAITGHGSATKSDIAHILPRLIPFSHQVQKIDDELDAIAVALTHSVSFRK